MPSAADLRQRVQFQRRDRRSDGYGNTEGPWRVLCERAAKLTPTAMGRDEKVLDARLQSTAIWDCWVRSDDATRGLTPDDRAVDASDPDLVFAIRSVLDMDGRRQFLLLQLQSGVAT